MYLSGSDRKGWRFQAWTTLEPWSRRYRCSAPPLVLFKSVWSQTLLVIFSFYQSATSLLSRIDLVSKNLLANYFRNCRNRNNWWKNYGKLIYKYRKNRKSNKSYAVDTKLHLSHQDLQAVEHGINLDLINTIQWFQQHGMIANPDKYQALVLGNTTHNFNIKCEEKPIPVSGEIQLLGVTLDNNISWSSTLISHLSAGRQEDK